MQSLVSVPPRIKVLSLGDHPLVPSGVGIQCKLAIECLLKTGSYQFYCLGGAIQHTNYSVQSVAPEVHGEGNWLIEPVNGHGSKERLRELLQSFKPDVLCMTSDPRFYTWLFEMEDEVRAVCPIVYWHVWDNDPLPEFNRHIYEACDHIMALSLKTFGILQGLDWPKDRYSYVPHAEPADIFKPLPAEQVLQARQQFYGPFADREFVLMWNNRNARRKMTGDIVEAFARFANKVGRHRTALLMHTQAGDPEGQDIHAVVKQAGVRDLFLLSENRVTPEQLNLMYNVADCVINLSNAEGFGLGTLEALYAGTSIVVNMTGGLQFQAGDWWCDQTQFSDQDRMHKMARSRKGSHQWWGEPVFPAVRSLVGSQQVPYIYDDRVNDQAAADAIEKVFKMGRPKRKALGLKAREWALEKFGMPAMGEGWDRALRQAIDGHKARRNMMGQVRTAAI